MMMMMKTGALFMIMMVVDHDIVVFMVEICWFGVIMKPFMIRLKLSCDGIDK